MAAGVIGFCASNIATADEVLKFRIFTRAVSVQSLDVGDVDGHSMYLGHFAGLASFPDGSVGAASLSSRSQAITLRGLVYFLRTSTSR
jgi:hypothetical protein